MVSKLLAVSLAIAASTYAAPVTMRDAPSDCNVELTRTASLISFACSGTASSNAQLAALGQQACANATSVAVANLASCSTVGGAGAKRTARKSKGQSQGEAASGATGQKLAATAGSTGSAATGFPQAQACAAAVASSFAAASGPCGISGLGSIAEGHFGKRDDCTTAQQAAFRNISAACPASALSGSAAVTALNDVTGAGVDAGRINTLAEKLANATAQAAAFAPPSAENCVQNSLPLARNLTAGFSLHPGQAGLAAILNEQAAANAGAMLGVVVPGCGAVVDLQSADHAAFAAGVGQAQGRSCFNATVSAADSAARACFVGGDGADLTSGTLTKSANCTAAQITSVGLISAACPASAA